MWIIFTEYALQYHTSPDWLNPWMWNSGYQGPSGELYAVFTRQSTGSHLCFVQRSTYMIMLKSSNLSMKKNLKIISNFDTATRQHVSFQSYF